MDRQPVEQLISQQDVAKLRLLLEQSHGCRKSSVVRHESLCPLNEAQPAANKLNYPEFAFDEKNSAEVRGTPSLKLRRW